MVVGKILRSMGAKYNHVVADAIEESRDITKAYTRCAHFRSLSSHEARLISQSDQGDEKALHVRNELSSLKDADKTPSRGRGREQGASMVAEEKEKEVSNLFMVLNEGESPRRSYFTELDESQKLKVRLGDDKEIEVEGRGTVAISFEGGSVKLLHDVQFVPGLAHNLLSVGQLLSRGFSVVFDGDTCSIFEKNSGELITTVRRTDNNMFLLRFSSDGKAHILCEESRGCS
ncbi:uncharacterized protein LOC120263267 [Dioscorea cayenensis subsp. rotundata]|uniref:Uncharacterized protein LOC120263267 n=1 Tax=Dioscorea cayennensis subsp. rotundata TaxID=55577 RepID=A0AB40BL23_DIOCR|nr:uncharacterized protein LOC120263267 [Dioscorea cayenensis subsp. rotundata]